ncbi:MAG: beta-N-acetylhexosaminidase [Myxococcales bacterium]|nr:MAG: beta-N-acetylhexosaminidase [Myxococcales bacterium]
MNSLSLQQAAGQVLIAGFMENELPQDIVEAIHSKSLGGIILFKRNIQNLEQTQSLLHNAHSCAPEDAPILSSVDQEGGRVSRLSAPFLQLPAMRTLAQYNDPGFTERCAFIFGTQLRALGFTMDFAPVLDIHTNPQNPVIGDRAFGENAEQVIEHGGAFARGLRQAGILSCGKHFPGHGDTISDSHETLPRLEHSLTRLKAIELEPFRTLATAVDAIMTAHIIFPELDSKYPATLSPSILATLARQYCCFNGIIISDDLDMKAISNNHSIADAAVLAIEAGCDALLVCQDPQSRLKAQEGLRKAAEKSLSFENKLRAAVDRFSTLRTKQHKKKQVRLSLEQSLNLPEINEVKKRLESVL